MEDDNIYPLDGEAFTLLKGEPEEQQQARTKEKGKVLQALPMLKDIIARFQEQIDLLGSLDSIPRETRTDQNMLLVNFHANDVSRRFLISQKEWLEGLIDDYSKL
jgi:hypothetical protein